MVVLFQDTAFLQEFLFVLVGHGNATRFHSHLFAGGPQPGFVNVAEVALKNGDRRQRRDQNTIRVDDETRKVFTYSADFLQQQHVVVVQLPAFSVYRLTEYGPRPAGHRQRAVILVRDQLLDGGERGPFETELALNRSDGFYG